MMKNIKIKKLNSGYVVLTSDNPNRLNECDRNHAVSNFYEVYSLIETFFDEKIVEPVNLGKDANEKYSYLFNGERGKEL